MDLQAIEQGGDRRIKFVALDGKGQPLSDATEADYKALFQKLPSGWSIKSVRDAHTHVLSKGKTELAAVEHETGLELILPVAQGVAAGLATKPLEDFLSWAWKRWLAVRSPDSDVPGATGRQPPTFRVETATAGNGAQSVQHKDFGTLPPFAELREMLTPDGGKAPEHAPAPAEEDRVAAEGNDVPMAAIRKGNLDKRGLRILDVYWAVRDYRIYRTERGISPHFSDDRKTALKQRKLYMDIGPRLSKLNGLLNVRFIENSEAFFNREIARAVALTLEGKKKEAEETLKHVEERASKSWQMAARTEYIAACGLVTLIVNLAWLIYPSQTAASATASNLVFQVAAMGSLGAFLSVAMGIATLEVDPYASKRYNYLTGLLRIAVGTLGAILLYLILKSEVFAGLAVGTGATGLNEYAIFVLCAAAGFSERMVPNIMEQISNQAADKADKGDAKGKPDKDK